MAEFDKMTKAELVGLATDLSARVAELEAKPADDAGNGTPAQGLIQILSLWGTDPQGNEYRDKNGRRMFIGQISGRVLLSANSFKTAGSRQPDLRGSIMPFRARQDGDAADPFAALTNGDAAEISDEPAPF